MTDCQRWKLLKSLIHASSPFTALSLYTHIYAQGHWGNDNRDMLMCANDVVISWRVQMEREINTNATGNEVCVYHHMCMRMSVGCDMRGGRYDYCMEDWSMRRDVWRLCILMSVCVSLSCLRPPWTLTSFSTRCASHRKTLWPPPESGQVCICPASQMSWTHFFFFCIFFWAACGVCCCFSRKGEPQIVPLVSQLHLHLSDSTVCVV